MKDTLWDKPGLRLLVKLGSLLVHAEEFMEPGGSPVDYEDFKVGMNDPEVKGWIAEGTKLALLPLKRNVREKP